jgi:TetR/AcrR family transcriptional regulator, transcriptional repressor for nem operon
MRYPASQTAEKHEKILKEAARLFRERGFDDAGIAEIMKAAGLTHGAFYAHFASKEELEAEAVERIRAIGQPHLRCDDGCTRSKAGFPG